MKVFVWGKPQVQTDVSEFLIWQRGGPALLELRGGQNARVVFSVMKQQLAAGFVLEQAAARNDESAVNFSLSRLPIEQQNSFGLLLMIPFGALVVVIMRNFIGIKTTGTFMPILLAMAFLDTTLLSGLFLFVVVVSVGLMMRSYLSRLDLLLVPRISAVVVVVIGIMVTFGILGAQFNLALMYKNGEGVIQDDKEAVNLYRFAAEQGHAKAQSNLGFMYALGQGVTQDYVHAHMWCNLAASNGHKIARENLGKIAKEMTPAQIDEAKDMAKNCKK
jgi:TPR repeat protein